MLSFPGVGIKRLCLRRGGGQATLLQASSVQLLETWYKLRDIQFIPFGVLLGGGSELLPKILPLKTQHLTERHLLLLVRVKIAAEK